MGYVIPVWTKIGKTIARERAKRGWNQTELAVKSGRSISFIQKLEAGNPVLRSNFGKVAAVLGMSEEALGAGDAAWPDVEPEAERLSGLMITLRDGTGKEFEVSITTVRRLEAEAVAAGKDPVAYIFEVLGEASAPSVAGKIEPAQEKPIAARTAAAHNKVKRRPDVRGPE